jgi:LysM repeat protein
MKTLRDLLVGLLLAIVSTVIVLGSLSLSLVEGGLQPSRTSLASPAATISITTLPPPAVVPATVTPTSCGAPDGWVRYVIQPADTLKSLSLVSGVSEAQLRAANCLRLSDTLQSGDIIFVPHLILGSPTPTPPLPSATASIPPATQQTGTFLSPTALINNTTAFPSSSPESPADTITPAPFETITTNP